MSNFKKVLDILQERKDPLEKEHYKVKFDRSKGYYTIVSAGQIVKAGITLKSEAEKICKKNE